MSPGFFLLMRFCSGWLKRLIWTLWENPPLSATVTPANHNTANSSSSKWDQLSPVTSSSPWVSLESGHGLIHTHGHIFLRCYKDFKVAETDCCRSARYLKTILCFLIHTFVCLLSPPTIATQLLPLTIYTYTFLPPSLLLLLSVCLCPGWERGSVFIVSGWI